MHGLSDNARTEVDVELIDTHCHLAHPAFDADRDEVIARAMEEGVRAALVMGETYAENEVLVRSYLRHFFLRPCLGHYPEHLDLEMASASADLIRTHAHEIAGIGEVGLDYQLAETESDRAVQRRILSGFVGLANELDLALSVHSRSAGHYTIDLLAAEGARRAVLHAFDGRAVHALRGVAAGFFFSIPPSLLRSRQKEKLVHALPLSALLLESDAPVLGPQPDMRNEPRFLRTTAERIAAIKRCDVEEVAAVTTRNARALFRVG
jgi:TatD DNase family protein